VKKKAPLRIRVSEWMVSIYKKNWNSLLEIKKNKNIKKKHYHIFLTSLLHENFA